MPSDPPRREELIRQAERRARAVGVACQLRPREVLVALARHEPASIPTIAAACDLDSNNCRRVLLALHAEGLVERCHGELRHHWRRTRFGAEVEGFLAG